MHRSLRSEGRLRIAVAALSSERFWRFNNFTKQVYFIAVFIIIVDIADAATAELVQ